jgi:hypothetical protein
MASAVLNTSRLVVGCVYIDAANMASGIWSSGSGPSVIIVTVKGSLSLEAPFRYIRQEIPCFIAT